MLLFLIGGCFLNLYCIHAVFIHMLCGFYLFLYVFSVARSLSTLYFFLRSLIWILFTLYFILRFYSTSFCSIMISFYLPYLFFFQITWIFSVTIEGYKFFSKTPISYIQILIHRNFSLCFIRIFWVPELFSLTHVLSRGVVVCFPQTEKFMLISQCCCIIVRTQSIEGKQRRQRCTYSGNV